jgi:porin
VLGAVFDGDSAGPGPDDPQLRNRYGINFRINDPPLVLGEAQFLWNGKKGDSGLDGRFKLGAWRHFGLFNDQRFDGTGISLANTASNGMPGLCAEISGSIPSPSRRYTASAETTTAV